MHDTSIEPSPDPVRISDAEPRFRPGESSATFDQLSLNRILFNLRSHLDTLIDDRPLDALALALVVQAAENIRTAARTAENIAQDNRESARRRAALERHKAIDAFRGRLKASPAAALAEAKFAREGCRGVIAVWRSLGEALGRHVGWNEDELTLARELTGSPEPDLKTTRDRVRLDRALGRDAHRPTAELAETVERVMNGYIDRLQALLARIAPGERLLHEIVIETVQDKAFDLTNLIGGDDRETIARYRARVQARSSGRVRWASARGFVAGQIRAWRNLSQAMPGIDPKRGTGDFADAPGTAEMRKAEWARKNLSAAIADFQKTLALGKSIGLPEVICPKPPKATKKTAAKPADSSAESAETSAERIGRYADTMQAPAFGEPGVPHVQSVASGFDHPSPADTRRMFLRANMVRATWPLTSGRMRDALGRFLPGGMTHQPRDARGRFRKAMPGEALLESSGRVGAGRVGIRTTSCSLRPTPAGRSILTPVRPNVADRDRATGAGAETEAESTKGPATCSGKSTASRCARSRGACARPCGSNQLADFRENVQNDGCNRMPGSDQVSESRSDMPPDSERGVAGDGER